MSKWEDNIRKVIPYTPGEQPKLPGLIKLNTNENPYPPAPGVKEVLEQIDTAECRLYPDPSADILVEKLAAYHLVDKEQVFVGVGSDDVISMCFLTFFNSGKPILFPDITYSFYDVWADVYRIPYETKPLNHQFEIVSEDYCIDNGGIIFPNPNAPTGILLEQSQIEKILQANENAVVIIDEAYIDFSSFSTLPLIEKYDNLIVVRTFSKSRAMAGMRIGYCVGSKKLIKYLNDVKYSINSYTMNLPSILCGAASIEDEVYFTQITNKIIATRERVKKELLPLGFSFPDSAANFLFVTHESIPAEELFLKLKEEKIYVRYFKRDRIDNYLRITIGTDKEMDILLKSLALLTGMITR